MLFSSILSRTWYKVYSEELTKTVINLLKLRLETACIHESKLDP